MLAPEGHDDNHRLVCYCLPVAGIQRCVKTTLNLGMPPRTLYASSLPPRLLLINTNTDEGIANDNGTLKCAGGMASLTHGPDEELSDDE